MSEPETIETDVLIVGGGPAGLAAAIRLKQLKPELGVLLLEKGAEIGAHILSGAVIDPGGLDELLPEWRGEEGFPRAEVTTDRYFYLTARRAVRLPQPLLPNVLRNHGSFAVSLGDVCRYLGRKAEASGVDILTGFAGARLLYDRDGAVTGVATGDFGCDANGAPGPGHSPGAAIHARFTILAEGARGSLAREAISTFDLDRDAEPQKYGLGFKEIWEVPEAMHRPGTVAHFFGWPLPNAVGGGGFLYHLADGKVAVGLVVHLDYANPWLSPFEEFQRFKQHPRIRPLLADGTRLGYGARAIVEGGAQSVPRLAFPGGVLVGDAAGFVNLVRIKGSHNAIRSGRDAANHVVAAIAAGGDSALDAYERGWRLSSVGADLLRVQNAKPLWSRLGTLAGIAAIGIDLWCHQLFGRSPLPRLRHVTSDRDATEPALRHRPIAYPRPDGRVSFDRLSSVYLSGTAHRDGQPVHLRLQDPEAQRAEAERFAGLSSRYCPAGVYEWVERDGSPSLVINSQNCIHCKTCDIKDPLDNIRWTPPEGGGGPNYGAM